MMRFTLRYLTNYASSMGDAPFFDPRNNSFYYVDIGNKKIHRVTLKDHSLLRDSDVSPENVQNSNRSLQDCSLIRSIQQRQFEDKVNFVLPTEEDENLVCINIGKNLVIYDFDNSRIVENLQYEYLKSNEYITTAKCDAKNRLFFGTYIKTETNDFKFRGGGLYFLEGRLLIKVTGELIYPMGFAWSSNNSRRFFFIDSGDHVIFEGEFNEEHSHIMERKVVYDLKQNPFVGRLTPIEVPYGCTVDRDDNLWIALQLGGRILKINPTTRTILEAFYVRHSCVTSVCFAKVLNQDVLFLTFIKSNEDTDLQTSGRCMIVQVNKLDLKPVNSVYMKISTIRQPTS